ncbi:uncharacterized protein LOC126904310 isoform X2 [Daktulosphaira vitifoliae]|uniref:uncharacterized protein LOC126904310 isoform X2 n=1 Tax=Daktulosphaira vitifoliae TaxID=58002 RepID=UPI0021AA9108|nr:uncharacterized protein LOC126904310 isoform X2 [Daktulosphaira vitifoliae]
MSDRRFGFSSHFQNRCALCLTEDDSNRNIGTAVCQHNASVESALHYLRNYGAPVSPPYASYHSGHDGSTTTLPAYGGSPPMSPNYYKLAEFLLRMNQMQENGGHQVRQPTSRPPKPKSELGCLRECAFCKSNGETAEFYKSHFLKDPVGRVRCPILQRKDKKLILNIY